MSRGVPVLLAFRVSTVGLSGQPAGPIRIMQNDPQNFNNKFISPFQITSVRYLWQHSSVSKAFYHKRSPSGSIAGYHDIGRKFRMSGLQEPHSQKYHICLDNLFFAGSLHYRPSAIRVCNPFHFFHFDSGYTPVSSDEFG